MGILNLLKEFGPATQLTHLSSFSGRTIGVDAMCWLHRSAFCCALELVRSEDPSTNTPHPVRYLYWLRKMVQMLVHFKITPIFVFDGAALPAKQVTNTSRDVARAAYRRRGDAAFAAGQLEEAANEYGKCINITPLMKRNFQHLLKQEQVRFMIAPYEADAQIGYLYKLGEIYAAITEDSDLLPFGCRRILLKLDREGNCKSIDLDAFEKESWSSKHYPHLNKLKRIMQTSPYSSSTSSVAAAEVQCEAASSSNAIATPAANPNFIHACVLSGCDYLPSLHGIGLKKAIGLVDDHPRIDHLLYHLKKDRKKLEEKWEKEHAKAIKERRQLAAENGEVIDEDDESLSSSKMSTQDYIAHFYKAVLTFQHQLIYDPNSKSFKHLTPLPKPLQLLFDRSIDNSTDKVVTIDEDDTTNCSTSADSLPSSHPLAQLSDFSFLGPPIPLHLTAAFVEGRIDPKTLEPYPSTSQITDLNALAAAAQQQKQQNGWHRRSSATQPQPPPVEPTPPTITKFFNRAASTPVHSSTLSSKPFSLTPSSRPTVRTSALRGSSDLDPFDDFFDDSDFQPLNDSTEHDLNSERQDETQPLVDDEFDQPNVNDAAQPPASTTTGPSSNPFAMKEIDIPTFASFSTARPFSNVTASVVGSSKQPTHKSASTFLNRIFGSNPVTHNSTPTKTATITSSTQLHESIINTNSSSTASSFMMTQRTDTLTLTQSTNSNPPSKPSEPFTAFTLVNEEDDVCDLTGDVNDRDDDMDDSSFLFPTISTTSNHLSPSTSTSTSTGPNHPLPSMKRKSSSPSSSSGQTSTITSRRQSNSDGKKMKTNHHHTSTPTPSLLTFFNKTVKAK